MNYKVEDFMVPFQQTANLCGLKLLPPVYSNGMMYVEGLSTADDLQIIEKKAREHAQRLFTLISTLN